MFLRGLARCKCSAEALVVGFIQKLIIDLSQSNALDAPEDDPVFMSGSSPQGYPVNLNAICAMPLKSPNVAKHMFLISIIPSTIDSRPSRAPNDLVQLCLNLVHLADRVLPLRVRDTELFL